jgi:glutamine synthetase adenylyltransferase
VADTVRHPGHRLVDARLAAGAQTAYRALRSVQHKMQLAGKDPGHAVAASLRVHATAIDALWQSVLGER